MNVIKEGFQSKILENDDYIDSKGKSLQLSKGKLKPNWAEFLTFLEQIKRNMKLSN
jgi:hypothetical protein